jgi:hypothetical protein
MLPAPLGGRWIWEGLDPQEEAAAVAGILSASLQDYSAVTSGNRLILANSPYLGPDTTVVFTYWPAASGNLPAGPRFAEHHILDGRRQGLPKLMVFSDTLDTPSPVDVSNHPFLRTGGESVAAVWSSCGEGSIFFRPTPVLNMIYRMRANDLTANYDVDKIAVTF